MSNPFIKVGLPTRKSLLTAQLVATAMVLGCSSIAAIAADMAVKEPQAPAYQWTGCYVGLNLGGGTSGTNFSSSVGPGTHLLGADPAVVAGSGGGGFNADGPLAGGQVGCNWQSGTLVLGLEGDFDYFHSTPGFSNNTNTLSDGVTPFTISQSLTTNYLATIRPRIGIGGGSQPRLHNGRCRFHPGQLHGELYRWRYATWRWYGHRFQKSRGMDRRRRLGICLGRPLDGARRVSLCGLSKDQRARCDHRRRRRLKPAGRLL